MKGIDELNVFYKNEKVGVLVELKDHRIGFEYDPLWIKNGFSISPLSLPLKTGLMVPKRYDPFDGLFGVFADSLPDGWGRLLTDRMLRKRGVDPASLSVLDRLSIVGTSGMGALEYKPETKFEENTDYLDFDGLARECQKLFEEGDSRKLDEIYRLGGSSGGARPKANISVQDESWIIKFPCSYDPKEIGKEEYDYHECARCCGLNVPETQLFPSKIHQGFFGTKRFDRQGKEKVHMVSAGALLETSHRIPNLDYITLMKLTRFLTKRDEDCWNLFDLMCFNVFSHNQDDHAKNFSFLFLEGEWHLSPVYDLTYSSSFGGEHSTTVNGKGKNIEITDLTAVAKVGFLDEKEACRHAQTIRRTVQKQLASYLKSR